MIMYVEHMQGYKLDLVSHFNKHTETDIYFTNGSEPILMQSHSIFNLKLNKELILN